AARGPARGAVTLRETLRPGQDGTRAKDADVDGHLLARRQGQDIDGLVAGELARRRIKAELRAALDIIEADIAEHGAVLAEYRRRHLSAAGALDPANFEQVREVGGEIQADPEALRPGVEIAQHDALAACALPQEARAAQVDNLARQHN